MSSPTSLLTILCIIDIDKEFMCPELCSSKLCTSLSQIALFINTHLINSVYLQFMKLKPIYILGKHSTTNLHSNLYFINFKHTLSLYPITSETKISSWLSVVMHAHNPSSWIAALGLQHI